jgi:hypothetical protein
MTAKKDPIAEAIATLEAVGYRVRAPGAKREPRPDREYADPAAVTDWAKTAIAKRGSQQAVADALGLKVFGPVYASMKGRPLSAERFMMWQATLAAAPVAEKPAKAEKSAKAPRAKATVAPKKPAKNSGGNLAAGDGPRARAEGPPRVPQTGSR